MKVFISWSGEYSFKVALVFRDWLPSVIQSIDPFVSSDIDKGARWSTDISKELEESSYGILCVTHENIDSPWLNFEAGALSKAVDKSKVSPFLFGVKRTEIKGQVPILLFQSTIYEAEDVYKLLKSINNACGDNKLSDERLTSIFDIWWSVLEEQLDELLSELEKKKIDKSLPPQTKKDNGVELIEEILELVRSQQRILNSPEDLIPENYLRYVLATRQVAEIIPRDAIIGLTKGIQNLTEKIGIIDITRNIDNKAIEELRAILHFLGRIIAGIDIRYERSRRRKESEGEK